MNPIEAGYITVAERLEAFVNDHPEGRISTELVYSTFDPGSASGLVVVSAAVFKDRGSFEEPRLVPDGTGLASMPIPGPTSFTKHSEVENAETSAIGRALAAIGYLAKTPDGKPRISSDDEITAKSNPSRDEEKAANAATDPQLKKMFAMSKKAKMSKEELQEFVLRTTGKHSSKQLTRDDMDTIFENLTVKAVEVATGGEAVPAS